MKETITSLYTDLHTQKTNSSTFVDTMPCVFLTDFWYPRSSNENIAKLEKTVHELRDQLATFQCTFNQEKDSLNETISSLRAELRAEHQSSSASITALTHASLTSESARQQDHTSRTNQSGTLRPTCRVPTQSRVCHPDQPCSRADTSLRIPLFSRTHIQCCGISSRDREYYSREFRRQQVSHRLAYW